VLTERTLTYYSDRGGKKKGEIIMPAVVFIDEVRRRHTEREGERRGGRGREIEERE
jgi:hypothetical protein